MVIVSFSVDGLIYKILTKSKQSTIRPLNKKWKSVIKKHKRKEKINLEVYWKQRSKFGFKLFDSALERIEVVKLEDLNNEDAIKDGFDTVDALLKWFEKQYEEDTVEGKFARIFWSLKFDEGIVNPNHTTIDWFDSLNQKLFTVNPFVFHKVEEQEIDGGIKKHHHVNCLFRCRYCYARGFFERQPDNFPPGFYESRLRGLEKCKDNVFMESISDLFHPKLPDDFLRYIIAKSNHYNKNDCRLFFLTKNPVKYINLLEFFNPHNNWIGITAETDDYSFQRINNITSAPDPDERLKIFGSIDYELKFVSIEPIFKYSKDFIEKVIASGIKLAMIGVNSDRLTRKIFREPNAKEIKSLSIALEENNIKVIEKKNLDRVLPKGYYSLDKFI